MPPRNFSEREYISFKANIDRIRTLNASDSLRANDPYLHEVIDFSSPQAMGVFRWMSQFPEDLEGFVDPATPPQMTVEVYKDFLNWASSTLQRLEKHLEKFELEYRRLGLI